MSATSITSELAGLGTALAWSLSALAWGLAGRRVGSVPVTAIRIVLAALVLAAACWCFTGVPWPREIQGESLVLLIISGLLGAFAADLCLFRGLVLIGPRMGMLIMSLSPILSGLLAFMISGETPPSLMAMAGILLTVAGVAWAVSDRRGQQAWQSTRRGFKLGVVMCLLSAFFASGGYVFSRLGMAAGPRHFTSGPDLIGVDPLSTAVLRMTAAAIATWLALPLMRSGATTIRAFRDRRAMLITAAGTIVGPVLGVWLSMIALKDNSAGVAVALIHAAPIFMIPVAYFAYGEKPTMRGLSGTCLAVAGIFMMMMTK